MSIKSLAVELYRAQQEVDALEKKLAEAHLSDKDTIRFELKQAHAVLQQMRRMMNGAKANARKTPSLIHRN